MTTSALIKNLSVAATSLATMAVVSLATPANAFQFGTSGIQFDEDTTVSFTFDQSHGAYLSTLGIVQLNNTAFSPHILFSETKRSDSGGDNEWKGTFGNAVTSPDGQQTQSFTFLGGIAYSLILWSDGFTNNPYNQSVSSTSWVNGGSQQAVFGDFNLNYDSTESFSAANNGQDADQFQAASLAQLIKGTRISFDDRGNGNDKDFQDLSIFATVPEPMTILGSLFGAAVLGSAKLRQKRQLS